MASMLMMLSSAASFSADDPVINLPLCLGVMATIGYVGLTSTFGEHPSRHLTREELKKLPEEQRAQVIAAIKKWQKGEGHHGE
jgi:hypothetical protein